MKNRFFLIALAILSMGLFVTSNIRAGDEHLTHQPEAQPAAAAHRHRRRWRASA